MTTATFDLSAVAAAVSAHVDASVAKIEETVEREADLAVRLAEEYANHLAAGGAADELPAAPTTGREEGSQFVHPTNVLQMVYRAWDDARGSGNPFSPVSSKVAWSLVEFALERGIVGSPILYADLHQRSKVALGRSTGWDSDQIAKALAALQGDALVLRRTKVGGKVAYLLRERREGEEAVGRYWDPENPTRIKVYAGDVPEEKWTP